MIMNPKFVRTSERTTTETITKKEVTFLRYPVLENSGLVCHGFSTRLGGVSSGIFTSMNLGFGRGDNEADVMENFKRFCNALSIDIESVVLSDQTHTSNIRKMTQSDRGKGVIAKKDYQDIDAMITNEAGVALTALFADCVPIYFLDPVKKAIGLAHSGWRGTFGQIGKKTVEAMSKEFGTIPSDLIACIGPSICQDCYEIDDALALKFINTFDPEEKNCIAIQKEDVRYHLDLWKVNELILISAGILQSQITLPDLCTGCNSDFLFSHRALNGKRGNLAAMIMLQDQ